VSPANRPAADGLTPNELDARLASGEHLTVVDVREPVERSFCAIKLPPTVTDLHIPMGDVTSRLEEFRTAATLGPILVYCHHGVRSRMVVEWLSRQGVPGVLNLEGGIDDWSEAVDPGVPRY
jgi:rhodanese-related sulfurtransferase